MISNNVDRRRALRVAVLLGGVALGLSWASTAQAATDIFLTWPGINGPSQAPNHVGDIELESYSQTASNNPFSPGASGGPGRGGPTFSNPICGQITVKKFIESTSPKFLGFVLMGTVTAGPVTITFFKAGGAAANSTPFYTVTLQDVVVTSITQSDSAGDDTVMETMVFQASQFRYAFTQQSVTGVGGTTTTFGWNCATNSPL
jgi:type VI secretion system secreted protein Hcp